MLVNLPKGKIGFEDLAQTISESWKNLDDETRAIFVDLARLDMDRYLAEKEAWQASVAELAKVHSSGSLQGTDAGGSLQRPSKKIPKQLLKKPRKSMQKRASAELLKSVAMQMPKPTTSSQLYNEGAGQKGALEPYSIEEMHLLPSLASRIDPSFRRFFIKNFSWLTPWGLGPAVP